MRILTVIVSALLLSACVSSSYPRVYTAPLPADITTGSRYKMTVPSVARARAARSTLGQVGQNYIYDLRPANEWAEPSSMVDRALVAAHDSQVDYAAGYLESAQHLDYSQIPIIAAAGIAALVLYNNPSNATDYLAGLGVGATFWSSTRSTLLPRRLPELYLLGHSALGCIRAEGPNFSGRAASIRFFGFRDSTIEFTQTIGFLRELYARARPDGDSQRAAFQNAMIALNEGVVAGTQALVQANRQLREHDRAGTVFGGAVADVHLRVATAARGGRIAEFAQLRQAFTDSIQAAGVPAQPATGTTDGTRVFTGSGRESDQPRTPAERAAALLNSAIAAMAAKNDNQLVETVWAASRLINGETQALIVGTPDYAGPLTRVSTCPSPIQ